MKHLQQIPQPILEIFTTLQKHYEVYFVGGCIRDALLNKEINDYDCTTLATPDQMKQVLSQFKIIETGIKHGTLTVINNHHRVEITTYRKESAYQNHRSPQSISFSSSLKEDCMRRDFTMNALAYDGKEIVDYFHGKQDIEHKIIRCIGYPQERFEEDALRILRAVRFSIQLGFTIESKTKEALFKCLPLLSHLSMERCRDELFSMLTCNSKDIFKTLNDYQCLDLFELSYSSFINEQLNHMPNDLTLRLACLFQNEHEAIKHLKLWKCSNKLIQQVSFILNHQSLQESNASINHLIYDSKYDFDLVRKFIVYKQWNFDHLESIIHNDTYFKQLAITGVDCLALGLQGKQIKEALDACIDLVCEDLTQNKKEILLEYLKNR